MEEARSLAAPAVGRKHFKLGEITRHPGYLLPALFIVVGSFFRVFVCLEHNPMNYLTSDMFRHWHNGRYFPWGGYFGAHDPILYQVYVFVLHKLTADHRLLVALASALLSLLMPWTYYRAARTSGLRKTAALWVWALIACTPSLVTIYHYIMMETLLLVVEGAALWMTARYLQKGGTGPFLVSVAFWTLACLTKTTVVFLAGVCLVWSWWKKSRRLRDIAFSAALVSVLLAPQAIRSKLVLGFLAPFGNAWPAMICHRSGARLIHCTFYYPSHVPGRDFRSHLPLDFYLDSPSSYIQPLLPFSHWAIRRAFAHSEIWVEAHGANGVRDWKEAYANLDVDWVEWFEQWRENVVLFLFAPPWPETPSQEWDGRLVYVTRWMWAPLIVFVLACNIRRFIARRFDLIPVAVTLYTLFLAFQNFVTMEGRFRKGLEPLLLLNLVWAVSKQIQRSPRRANQVSF